MTPMDVEGQTIIELNGDPLVKKLRIPKAKVKPDLLKQLTEQLPTMVGQGWSPAAALVENMRKRGVFCSIMQLVHAAHSMGFEFCNSIETRKGWMVRSKPVENKKPAKKRASA